MEEINQTIESIKKPLEAAIQDPSALANLADIEKTVGQNVEKVLSVGTLRFAVQMFLSDLRNEFKGFERLDDENKTAVVASACQIIGRLETFLDKVKDPILHESEIAEEMKAQAAADIQKQKAKALQQQRNKQRSRPQNRQGSSRQQQGGGPRQQKGGPRQQHSGNQRSAAPGGQKPQGDKKQQGDVPGRPPRRRRRPRRRSNKPKPPENN